MMPFTQREHLFFWKRCSRCVKNMISDICRLESLGDRRASQRDPEESAEQQQTRFLASGGTTKTVHTATISEYFHICSIFVFCCLKNCIEQEHIEIMPVTQRERCFWRSPSAGGTQDTRFWRPAATTKNVQAAVICMFFEDLRKSSKRFGNNWNPPQVKYLETWSLYPTAIPMISTSLSIYLSIYLSMEFSLVALIMVLEYT